MAKAQVKLEKSKPIRLAYIEHTGDYGAIPFNKYVERLYGWAKERRIRPGFYPMGIYHDSPENTPPEKCRSEIGIPIYGAAKPEGEIRIKDLPSMKVATISHRAPASEYPTTYRELSKWIAEHGYKVVGPSIEVYTRKPKEEGGKTILYAKIEAPVRKA